MKARSCSEALALLAILIAFCGSFSGCVHYRSSVPAGDPAFVGLKQSLGRSEVLRVFVIHGMTTHTSDFAEPFITELARGLEIPVPENWNYIECNVLDPGAVVDPETDPILRVYRLDTPEDHPRRTLLVYAYTWSGLTNPAKRSLDYDNAVPSALLNHAIKKGVINDGFSDAVLFNGKYNSDVIGRASFSAASLFLTKAFDGNLRDRISENVFVAHSLGSTILYNALLQINHPGSRTDVHFLKEEWVAKKSDAQEVFRRTTLFVMFANQMPLLTMDDAGGQHAFPSTQIINDVGQMIMSARQHKSPSSQRSGNDDGLPGTASSLDKEPLTPSVPLPSQQVDLLVFSDPNDLFSYPLLPEAVPRFRVHNYGFRNTCDLVGTFELPTTAHTGYFHNKAILRRLLSTKVEPHLLLSP